MHAQLDKREEKNAYALLSFSHEMSCMHLGPGLL